MGIKDSINKQFDQLYKRYLLLNQSTKGLIVLLLIAIGFSFLFNNVYKPKRTQMYRLEQEYNSIENKIIKRKGNLPDVVSEERLLNTDKKSLFKLKEQLEDLERQLPQQDSLPNLLGRLVKQSSGYDLDFKLIKPLEKDEEETYDKLNIEMRFAADFNSVVNYLRRLETIFEFLTTDSILVKKSEDDSVQDLQITMYLSTLLAEEGQKSSAISKINLINDSAEIVPKRNPYQSVGLQKQMEKQEEITYVLSGVILNGAKPTAIIDDDIYTIGDYIDDAQVVDITKEGVSILRGEKEYYVTIVDNNTE